MLNKIKFIIKVKKNMFILIIYGKNNIIFTIPFYNFCKSKIFKFYYIIFFLIKFGLIDVYI